MKKILIINAGQNFGHSGGKFNQTVTAKSESFFSRFPGVEVKVTYTDSDYDKDEEVEKFVWADYIIYHTPIWWFQLPHG
ncbi:MAG: NAD(P)H-dependent oxidoreductase, partial [Kaistella sp.]